MDKTESGSSGAGLSPARCDAKSERRHGREVRVYTSSWMRLPNAEVQICNLVRQLGCSCKGVDALVSGGEPAHAFPSARSFLHVLVGISREQGRLTALAPSK